ncbi:DNA damage-regulated autophagy modulator protein 2-like [Sarcoptes scabiei]|nr:DNA damage-regulated autophagy modulator protein 2-like [Sarcoptes scabiei]
MIENNTFSGFCVDLMDLIQTYSGLNYSLYLVEDGNYGPYSSYSNKLNGLIGDVYRKKADFAIADMTVTEQRARFVSFTEPFLRFSFSALVRRSLAKNLDTIDDLAIKSNLSIGTFMNGRTLLSMQIVRNDIRNVRWLYNKILQNDSNFVTEISKAIHKIKTEPYAFLQEEPKNLYHSSQDCSLKTLRDQNFYLPSEYAIAVPKGSPHIETFNKAIRMLKSKRAIDRLIRKYFGNAHCSSGSTRSIVHPKFIFLILLLLDVGFNCFVNFLLRLNKIN